MKIKLDVTETHVFRMSFQAFSNIVYPTDPMHFSNSAYEKMRLGACMHILRQLLMQYKEQLFGSTAKDNCLILYTLENTEYLEQVGAGPEPKTRYPAASVLKWLSEIPEVHNRLKAHTAPAIHVNEEAQGE